MSSTHHWCPGKAFWAGFFCASLSGEGVQALGDKLTQTLKLAASLTGMRAMREVAKEGFGPKRLAGNHPLCPLLSWSPTPRPPSFPSSLSCISISVPVPVLVAGNRGQNGADIDSVISIPTIWSKAAGILQIIQRNGVQ